MKGNETWSKEIVPDVREDNETFTTVTIQISSNNIGQSLNIFSSQIFLFLDKGRRNQCKGDVHLCVCVYVVL